MSINHDERAVLAGLADVLIPAGSGLPSASEAGVADGWLDAVLTARPDLAGGLRELLHRARDRTPADFVAELRAHDPSAFGILAEIVPNAYFMNPAVREAIGYSGQGPRPLDPRADYMEDGLLESVLRRGPIYRPTPGTRETNLPS